MTDYELVEQWRKERDKHAFHSLYDRHAGRVFVFARGFCGNDAMTDEIVQETFLKAAQGMRTFRSDSSFSTWILAIARNTAHDLGRKEARRKRDASREPVTPPPPCPAENAELSERQSAVRQAVMSLPENQRLAIALCSLQEMSIREAAEVLGWKEGTVKSTLSRAREELKRLLQKFIEE